MTNQALRRRQAAEQGEWSFDLPPLLQQLYAVRGIQCAKQLDRRIHCLADYRTLQGMAGAVLLLQQALLQRWFILVVGDFDADGATSTALMVLALRRLGAVHVEYLVPSRFAEGYGLTPAVVKQATQRGADLIVTVDTGISSQAGVALARAQGLRVLITDHHLPIGALPEAQAIVNPNLPDCRFPSKALAGVGVAFYVILALRAQLREAGWFAEQQCVEPNLAELLDLVALGTVADVVPLDANNRILVYQGLQRIRAGCCRPGIQALLTVSQRERQHLVAADLGFVLGPRLNAAGRLEDMSLGIELLLCEETDTALRLAQQLEALNQTRRQLEQTMQQQALEGCQQVVETQHALPMGLALYEPSWHQGVVGIVAARLKSRFNRPVIAFAPAGEGRLKGSGRSIPGVHLRDLLVQLQGAHPNLMESFGGHAMAVGLTLAIPQFDRFRALFSAYVSQQVTEEMLQAVVWSDGALAADALTLETAQLLREGGPWGQAFPEPLFDGIFRLQQQRLLGGKHLKMVVTPTEGGPSVEAIAFNIDPDHWPKANLQSVQLAYRLAINRFRGQQTLQLLVEQFWPV
jgi:single-stranded-DNA-specific exonuclease